MTTIEKTAKKSVDMVLKFLQKGGKHSPMEIGKLCKIQHNTVVKDLKFLRDAGHQIEKERVDCDGARYYFLYWLVNYAPKPEAKPALPGQKKSWKMMTIEEQIAEMERIIAHYPEDHVDAIKVRSDIEMLKRIVKEGKGVN
jgi:predicted transcriptional regulator